MNWLEGEFASILTVWAVFGCFVFFLNLRLSRSLGGWDENSSGAEHGSLVSRILGWDIVNE